MADPLSVVSAAMGAVQMVAASMKLAGQAFGGGYGSQSKDLRRMQKQVAGAFADYQDIIQSLLVEVLDDDEQVTRMLESPGDEMWKDSKIQAGIQDLMGQGAESFIALCVTLGNILTDMSRNLDQVRLAGDHSCVCMLTFGRYPTRAVGGVHACDSVLNRKNSNSNYEL